MNNENNEKYEKYMEEIEKLFTNTMDELEILIEEWSRIGNDLDYYRQHHHEVRNMIQGSMDIIKGMKLIIDDRDCRSRLDEIYTTLENNTDIPPVIK